MNNGRKFIKRVAGLKSLALPALVSLFVITTILIFGPIESYFNASDDIPFSIKQILPIFLVASAVIFLILCFLSSILRGKARLVFVCLLFSLGLGLYLQANFMNADYGLLDGHTIDWNSYGSYGTLNTVIWGCIFLVPLIILLLKSHLIVKMIKYISAFLIVVQLVTLGVLAISEKPAFTRIDAGLSNEDIYKVGSDSNVIYFVPDTFDSQYMDYLLMNNPEYLTELTGFTYFRNMIGSFPKTEGAVPFLLTGKYNLNETIREEYSQAAYPSSDLLKNLVNAGYDTRVFTDVDSADISPLVHNKIETENVPRSYLELGTMLEKYVLFRYTPHDLKRYFWLYTGDLQSLISQSNATSPYVLDDVAFYDKLVSNGLTKGSYKNAFRFIHLFGCHDPYRIDANVKYTDKASDSPIEQLKGMMTILNTYVRQLKALDVYDDATIIIVGDHGGNQVTQPAFLVKPPKASGALKVAYSPVSQLDIHQTIMSCAGLPAVSYGDSVFDVAEDSQRIRTFYMYTIYSENVKGYMPIMWEQKFQSDNLSPQFTHQVFAHDKPQDAAELASPISFDAPVIAKQLIKYFSPGFMSWGTDEYIWGNGRSGVMYFKVPAVPADGATITFQWINYFVTPSQRLIIKSGEDVLFDQEFNRGEAEGAKVHIPAKYFNADGSIALDVYCPRAESAINLGIGGEVRLQNFGFKSIIVSQGNTISPSE